MIVKNDSSAFSDVQDDVTRYLSIAGDLDLNDFFTDTSASRLSSSVSAIYQQIRKQLGVNRRENFIKSAVRKESVFYGAISQSNYSPKRNVAAQHSEGHEISVKITDDFAIADLQKLVFAETIIDGVAYPVSIIKDFNSVSVAGIDPHILVTGKAGVGQWRRAIIQIDENLGHLETFHTFHIDEDQDLIDDSNTIEIFVVTNNAVLQNGNLIGGVYHQQVVVDNINRIIGLTTEETDRAVVVTTNFHGGIDFNFGDGDVYGNGILDVRGNDAFDAQFGDTGPSNAAYIVVEYFVNAGFIPNLNFQKITYDSNIITEEPVIDPIITNGLDAESADSVKTLAPANNLSQYKIITPDDMATDFQSIPTVKSAFAIKDLTVSSWDASRDYVTGDIVTYLQVYYIFTFTGTVTLSLKSLPPKENPTYWLEVNGELRENNATLLLYALVAADTQSWVSTTTYNIGDVVFHKDGYWESIQDNNTIEPSELVTVIGLLWVKTVPNLWEPLTQMSWELEYKNQFNYPKRLGFLEVKVEPITSIIQNYKITVIINPAIKLTESSQASIDAEIQIIIGKYWEVLGVNYDVGEVVASINAMEEIEKAYIMLPVTNILLNPKEYFIRGEVDITYKSFSDPADRFCS